MKLLFKEAKRAVELIEDCQFECDESESWYRRNELIAVGVTTVSAALTTILAYKTNITEIELAGLALTGFTGAVSVNLSGVRAVAGRHAQEPHEADEAPAGEPSTNWYQLPGRPALQGEEPTGGGIIIY